MRFDNLFDEALAQSDLPAVFLHDRKGMLRFDATWTRDAWGRLEGTPQREPTWALLRDHQTGFVTMVYTTARDLLAAWPRADVRFHAVEAEARAARDALGTPPVCREAW